MKALRIVGIVLGILVLLGIGAWMALPPTLHVEVKQTLNAPASTLYAHASNLETWQHWTYWAVRDPSLTWTLGETTRGEGASMRWTGESGNGRLQLTAATPPERLAYQFYFQNEKGRDAMPAQGTLTFVSLGDQTLATWTLDTDLPGFARFLGLAYQGLVEQDFTQGLKRLEQYALQNPAPAADSTGVK